MPTQLPTTDVKQIEPEFFTDNVAEVIPKDLNFNIKNYRYLVFDKHISRHLHFYELNHSTYRTNTTDNVEIENALGLISGRRVITLGTKELQDSCETIRISGYDTYCVCETDALNTNYVDHIPFFHNVLILSLNNNSDFALKQDHLILEQLIQLDLVMEQKNLLRIYRKDITDYLFY